ncbi:retrovirus-related pol polyprotein from transposon TNT 1-94 [Tanacetum coccineum]|uniref:Retrovirus-related pol polyprotein from transposon TNT 1-94 n=1 Tax=Tanacetum coccineum TaxID=301880 RepID=A0ABQ5GZ24_9ASTR
MSEYYEGVGIFHQKSVLRTPQQNGVVERRNRTLGRSSTYNDDILERSSHISMGKKLCSLRTSASASTSEIQNPVQHQDQEIEGRTHFTKNHIIYDVLHLLINHVSGDPRDGPKIILQSNIVGNPSRPVLYQNTVSIRCCGVFPILNCPKSNQVLQKGLIEKAAGFQKPSKDEIHIFDRLEVWDISTRPFYVYGLSSKWIYKVKLDDMVIIFGILVAPVARLRPSDIPLPMRNQEYEHLPRGMSKCPFSDGDLQEYVFVSQPEDLKTRKNPTHAIMRDVRFQEEVRRELESAQFLERLNWFRAGHQEARQYFKLQWLNTSPCLDDVLNPFGALTAQRLRIWTSIKFLCTVDNKKCIAFCCKHVQTLALKHISHSSTLIREQVEYRVLNFTCGNKLSTCRYLPKAITKRRFEIFLLHTPWHEEFNPLKSQKRLQEGEDE